MDDHDQHHRRFEFSPLFIGLLGIIAGAIMVATYQCIAIGFCTQRRVNGARNIIIQAPDQQDRRPDNTNNSTTTAQLKPTIRFSKEFKEETCAVCLGEFLEGEEIRVLPECMHSFHAPCVDMWLCSHPNCPLCRAGAAPLRHVVVSVSDSGGDAQSVVQGLPNFEG